MMGKGGYNLERRALEVSNEKRYCIEEILIHEQL